MGQIRSLFMNVWQPCMQEDISSFYLLMYILYEAYIQTRELEVVDTIDSLKYLGPFTNCQRAKIQINLKLDQSSI